MAVFTPEIAKEMALKSLAKRLENSARIKEAAAIADSLSVVVAAQAEGSEVFKLGVLARVRKQIEAVLKMLETCHDPLMVEKLCRSLDSLCENERKLSGRPLPGSLRPTKDRPKRNSHPDPEPTPEPVAECAKVVPPDSVPTVLPASHDPNEPNG